MYILYKNRYFNFIYFNLFGKKINNDSQVFSYPICDRHNDHFSSLFLCTNCLQSFKTYIFVCFCFYNVYHVLRVVYISNNCNKIKNKTKQKQQQKRKQKQTQNKTKRITKQLLFNLTFDLKLLIYRSRNKLRRLYINDWYCDYYIIVYEMNTLGSSEQGQQSQPQSPYYKSHQQSKQS